MISDVLPEHIEQIIFKKVHEIHLKDVNDNIKENVVKSEKYELALLRMYSDRQRTWRINLDYSPDRTLKDVWNWQRYMKKAIEKYTIKLIGSKQYAMNKIGDNNYGYSVDCNLIEDISDGITSLDFYLEKSLCETSHNYMRSHKYEHCNHLRMVADILLCEMYL